MTNEELAMLIKNGDDGLLPQLWEQVRKYVVLLANRFYRKFDTRRGVELDDLIQSGYLAVLDAIKYYSPTAGFKFTTYLSKTSQNAFRRTMGLRTTKRDGLDYADSLDTPISEGSDFTLLDEIGDLTPGTANVESTVIESVWNQELHSALENAMAILSEKQCDLLKLHYYFGISLEQISEMRGCSRQLTDAQRYAALNRIYNSRYRKILAEFLYGYEPDPYMHVGLEEFRSHRSSQEEAFLICTEARRKSGQ